MTLRIALFGLALSLSSAHAITPDNSAEQALKDQKAKLESDAKAAADTCRCLAGQIENNMSVFDTKPFPVSNFIKKKDDVVNFITDMKTNAGKAQNEVTQMLNEWSDAKNTEKDRKNLNLKVSEHLRGMSSYCSQPYDFLRDAILKVKKDLVLDKAACTQSPKPSAPEKPGKWVSAKPSASLTEKAPVPEKPNAPVRPPPPTTKPRWVPTKPSETVVKKFPRSGK